MCEPGTDKCTCPDCPGTCQGHGDKRDYAADLTVAEGATKDWFSLVKANQLARTALPWYIRKVMELEREKAFVSAHENNIRQKHGLSPDVNFGDLAKYRDSLRAQLSEAQSREGRLTVQRDAAFNFIKKLIDRFESEPLSEDGTHRFIADASVLQRAKEALSPSPTADRWKAMDAVVEAAKELERRWPGALSEELADTLSALEKAGAKDYDCTSGPHCGECEVAEKAGGEK